jgi:hypothetical protein
LARRGDLVVPSQSVETSAVSNAAEITACGISSPGYTDRNRPFLAADNRVVLAVFRSRNAAMTASVRPSPRR